MSPKRPKGHCDVTSFKHLKSSYHRVKSIQVFNRLEREHFLKSVLYLERYSEKKL